MGRDRGRPKEICPSDSDGGVGRYLSGLKNGQLGSSPEAPGVGKERERERARRDICASLAG